MLLPLLLLLTGIYINSFGEILTVAELESQTDPKNDNARKIPKILNKYSSSPPSSFSLFLTQLLPRH